MRVVPQPTDVPAMLYRPVVSAVWTAATSSAGSVPGRFEPEQVVLIGSVGWFNWMFGLVSLSAGVPPTTLFTGACGEMLKFVEDVPGPPGATCPRAITSKRLIDCTS